MLEILRRMGFIDHPSQKKISNCKVKYYYLFSRKAQRSPGAKVLLSFYSEKNRW